MWCHRVIKGLNQRGKGREKAMRNLSGLYGRVDLVLCLWQSVARNDQARDLRCESGLLRASDGMS